MNADDFWKDDQDAPTDDFWSADKPADDERHISPEVQAARDRERRRIVQKEFDSEQDTGVRAALGRELDRMSAPAPARVDAFWANDAAAPDEVAAKPATAPDTRAYDPMTGLAIDGQGPAEGQALVPAGQGGSVLDKPYRTPAANPGSRLTDAEMEAANSLSQRGGPGYADTLKETPAQAVLKRSIRERTASNKLGREVVSATGSQFMGELTERVVDRGLDVAAIGPVTGKLAADIISMARVPGSDWLSNQLGDVSKTMSGAQSAAFQEKSAAMQEVAHNGTPAQLALFLMTNPGFTAQFTASTAIQSSGSMGLGLAGGIGGKLLAESQAMRGVLGTAPGLGSKGAVIGASAANAAMNAGSNFADTDGDLFDKYLSAAVAAGTTYGVGRMTGGGAEGALARGQATGRLRMAGKEALEEFGEGFGQSLGEQLGETGGFNPNSALNEGLLGALPGGVSGAAVGGRGVQAAPALSAADLARSKGFLGGTSFTPADSPSARAGLVDIVVPGVAPTVNLTDVQLPDGPQVTATPQTAEDRLKARLARDLNIPADVAPAAGLDPTQSAASTLPAGTEPIQSSPPSPTEQLSEASAPVPEPASAPATSAPAAPAETWRGRSGTGYATEANAQQAVAGRAQRNPALDWGVEPDGQGRYVINGHTRSAIDAGAHEAATSPHNSLPEPSQAQIESGNYTKGHVKLQGLDITIENPAGSTRSGTDSDGKAWTNTLQNHYGYIKGTVGADAEHVDTFIGPDHQSNQAFIVDQVDPKTGKFDEHKVILGATSEEQARSIYEANYAKGWKGAAGITSMPIPQFKVWVKAGVKNKPISAAARASIAPASATAKADPPTPAAQLAQGSTRALFVSRQEASIARRELGNGHRLQRVEGGYKLRPATDKELASADRNGQRLKRAAGGIDTDRDSLLVAVAKNGGLSMKERANTIREGNRNVGGRMLFTHQGRPIDVMARLLDQEGFIPADEVEADGGVRWLQNAVGEEFGGHRKHFSRSGTQWMRNARDEAMGDAPNLEAAGIDEKKLKDAGYFESDADVQSVVDAIVAASNENESREQFWRSLDELEQLEERNAIQSQTTTLDPNAGARARDLEEPAAGEARAGRRNRAPVAGQEEGGQEGLKFSKSGASSSEAAALKALSENDELFALPKSAGTTIEAIAADNDPTIKVTQTSLPGSETMWTLTMPDGHQARITSRRAGVYGPSVYSADRNDDGGYDWNTTRPGTNPDEVDPETEDVWLDVSNLKGQGQGTVVYNIASTFAHRTGRIFVGDPAGVTADAMRRRPEHMLSSALKFGTTRHLAPHPDQVRGSVKDRIPSLEWTYGDDLGNIRRLVALNLTLLENDRDASALSFNPASGRFEQSKGSDLLEDGQGQRDIPGRPPADRQLVDTGLEQERGLPDQRSRASGRNGSALAGSRTLKRGAVLRALVREESGEGSGRDGRPDDLLARLVRLSSVHPEATSGLFYSRDSGRTGRYQADLFGQPLPDLFGGRGDRWGSESSGSGDVGAASGVPSGTYASTTALATTGQQQLGHSGPVRSAADAAASLAYLSRSAVERFDGLVTDADGNPLAVIGGFKGALTQAAVYPATMLVEAVRIQGAANIFLVHNHPSGVASLSRADLKLQEEIARVFDGTGINVREIIAVTGDRFAAGSDGHEHISSTKLPARSNGPKVPRQEREIATDGKLAPPIITLSDARQATSEIAAAHGGRPGLLLLDAQNGPVAYVPWAAEDMLPLKGNGKLDALFRAISRSNAGAALISDPHGAYTLAQINNIAGALQAADVRPLDAIQNGRSLSESGELTPAKAFKSRGAGTSTGLSSKAELADALKAALPSLGKAFDKMLARGERGEKGGLVALESADKRSMAEALASKTPRTIEQAMALLDGGKVETFESTDGDTQGFYDPKSGLTFIVLPNVTAATVPGVVLHEATHSQQRTALDAKALALIDGRSSAAHPKATREFLERVARRMKDAGEARNPQEATSYLVEQALHEGRQEGYSAADGKFLAWVDSTFGKRVGGVIRDLVASLREWALRHGSPISPTVDDLVAFAKAGVRAAARGEVVTSGDVQNSSRADQTLTPAFRTWFGKSKVVDAAGKPLVVYHDSPNEFTTFRTRGLGENTGNTGMYGNGSYFSPTYNGEEEEQVANHRYRVYLSLQNPFEFDDERGRKTMKAVVSKLLAMKGVTSAEKSRGEAWLRDPKRSNTQASLAVEHIFQQPAHPETGVNMEGERLRVVLESNGFDGVIATNVEYTEVDAEYVAFHPWQIKSADNNNGNFDPADSDIRRSVKGDPAPAHLTPPPETLARKVQRYGQDMMNRFTVLKNWVESNGVKLSDDADVWSFEERMHGRIATRLDDFREKTVKPLVKKIQAAGFTMAQAGEYLHMQHAEERNLQIAKSEPAFKEGSGISTAAARKYLAQADPKLAAVANELRDITKDNLKVLLDAGIINTDMTRAFEGAYKHYAPLRGLGDQSAPGEPGSAGSNPGKGNSVDGDMERATGRSGGVDPYVVENILRAHESAIIQAEKNILGHSLIAFVTEIANPAVATIGEPEKRAAGKLGEQFEVTDDAENPTVLRAFDNVEDAYSWMGQQLDRESMSVRKTFGKPQLDAHVGALGAHEVKVYVAGHAIKVQLNDAGLSHAYQRLGIDKLPVYLAMSRDINRYLSKIYTGLNPEFSVVNPVRDFTTGVINVTGQFGAAASARAVTLYPKALAQLIRYTYTGKSTASIDEYRKAGGSTGVAYLGDIERIGADIQQSYNEYVGATRLAADGRVGAAAGVATRKLVAGLTGWIEALNKATENAFRLAVFEALKGEHGVNKAASAAKNSTVNFNRKGELGSAMGAMFLFFNPAVQGTASMFSALAHGEHKGQARAMVVGLVGVAYALACLQYGGGDDDDEEFKRIPNFVKDRSLIIRLPAGRYITIPVPYGYAFAVTAGNALYSATHGGDIDTISMSLASAVLDNFSPVGNPLAGADQWRHVDPKGLLELVPGVPFGDLSKDAVRIIRNRSGLGREIVPDSKFDEGKPDHLRLYRATKGSGYDRASRALSDLTGGTQTQAGGIDVSPETLKFWTTAITGGAGAFIADSVRLGELGARRLGGEAGDLSPELREIPIARKFVRDPDIRDSRSRYWDAANDAHHARQGYERAKKANDEAGMDKVLEEASVQLEAARSFIHYNRQIKRIRNEVDEVALDSTMSLGMKRIEIKELEAEERDLYDEAVKEYGLSLKADKLQKAAR